MPNIPHNAVMPIEYAIKRANAIRKVRHFFEQRGVLEVETPILSQGISTDCHIDVFSSWYEPGGSHKGSSTKQMYLQTSPEFHMKRLLGRGYPDIYQICKVFRNGERGRYHNPEFTLIEWYRKGFSMDQLIDEVADLCHGILGSKKVVKKTYQDVFIEMVGIDPLTISDSELLSFCANKGAPASITPTRFDALNYIMCMYIEPKLPKDVLVFIFNYPSEQAILATLDAKDTRVAHRFELYFNGIELCNGYEELVGWEENKVRLEEENQKRIIMGKPILPVDPHFIEALKEGIPRCSGVALGIDRLFMISLEETTLDSVLTFPWEIA
jgi:elongation factor P--(R)-beta-lysine ligase